DFSAVHPDLHANHAVRGLGFREAVLDIGTQGLQRQPPLQVPLEAGDFMAIQAAATPHLDSFAPETQRTIHGFAHGAAEANALLELQRDRLRDQLCIKLGLVHFLDVDVDLARSALLHFLFQLVDLGAFAADDDAGTRGLDDDAQLVARTLDLDGAD